MFFALLTTLILVVHFAYLAYVVTGGFLAWRWPRTVVLHVAAAAWGLLIVTNPWGWQCPLTYAERWSRARAGQEGLEAGFVDRYLEGVIYPERYTLLLQVLVGVAVVGSWIGLWWRLRRRRTRTASTYGTGEATR